MRVRVKGVNRLNDLTSHSELVHRISSSLSRASTLFSSREFGTCRNPVIQLMVPGACFQYVACGLCIAPELVSLAEDGGNAEHRDDNHDLEDREVTAAEIHGVYREWAYGCGADPGAGGAF